MNNDKFENIINKYKTTLCLTCLFNKFIQGLI